MDGGPIAIGPAVIPVRPLTSPALVSLVPRTTTLLSCAAAVQDEALLSKAPSPPATPVKQQRPGGGVSSAKAAAPLASPQVGGGCSTSTQQVISPLPRIGSKRARSAPAGAARLVRRRLLHVQGAAQDGAPQQQGDQQTGDQAGIGTYNQAGFGTYNQAGIATKAGMNQIGMYGKGGTYGQGGTGAQAGFGMAAQAGTGNQTGTGVQSGTKRAPLRRLGSIHFNNDTHITDPSSTDDNVINAVRRLQESIRIASSLRNSFKSYSGNCRTQESVFAEIANELRHGNVHTAICICEHQSASRSVINRRIRRQSRTGGHIQKLLTDLNKALDALHRLRKTSA